MGPLRLIDEIGVDILDIAALWKLARRDRAPNSARMQSAKCSAENPEASNTKANRKHQCGIEKWRGANSVIGKSGIAMAR